MIPHDPSSSNKKAKERRDRRTTLYAPSSGGGKLPMKPCTEVPIENILAEFPNDEPYEIIKVCKTFFFCIHIIHFCILLKLLIFFYW